jgi:predicted ATPase/DNA-binding XRE family transcriptional regulator
MKPTAFGALLKHYRMAAGLTQEALAERANLSTRAISDLERGINRAPRYDTLNMLTSAMGLSAGRRASLFAAARPALPGEHAKAAPLHVLPLPPTALLGREQEVAHALGLLRERSVRLLTVTGPSGVGKTRLALEIAHDLSDDFADGLAWIELAAIRDPALVPQAVAQTLRLREQADRPPSEQVRAFLWDRQFLLLLDNLEQVLSAAGFVADLLASCLHLQVLVTSRVPLHLRAEQQLVLTPLAQAAAVALFRERAQRVQPLLDGSSPTVAAICDQVDRLPLAIELAAAHVKALSLPLLLERLANRLRLLHGGARDLPKRQRTMQEAIAWSYDLLTAAEQRCFRTLGVFMGGCTLAAAEAVCWEEETIAANEGLEVITAIVDASLLQAERTEDDPPRYRMLEVIREYAVERLRAVGEEEQYRRRHAEYYALLGEEASRLGPAQGSREAPLKQEFPNVREALHWAHEQREATLGLRLITSFGRSWFMHGQVSEGNLWLEKMLALDATAGEQAAPLALRTAALYGAWRFAMSLGKSDRAATLAGEALALAERTGNQSDMSNALAMLGSNALATGSEDEAATYFTESYAAAKRAGEAGAIDLALFNLVEIARKRGDVARATELLEELLAHARAIEMTWGIANVLNLLGHLARQQHDHERAKVHYRESLALYRRFGSATYIALCLEGIAAVACAEHHYERATRLCAAAAVLRIRAHTPLPPSEQEDFDKIVMTAHAELDEMAFAEEWRIGSTLTQDEAISYALMGLPT